MEERVERDLMCYIQKYQKHFYEANKNAFAASQKFEPVRNLLRVTFTVVRVLRLFNCLEILQSWISSCQLPLGFVGCLTGSIDGLLTDRGCCCMVTISQRQFALYTLGILLLLFTCFREVAFLELEIVLPWLRWTALRWVHKTTSFQLESGRASVLEIHLLSGKLRVNENFSLLSLFALVCLSHFNLPFLLFRFRNIFNFCGPRGSVAEEHIE